MTTTWDEHSVAEAVDRLVEECRLCCLWFLRTDYLPATNADRVWILALIERHGDRDAYQRAATLRRWLSPTSNAESAAS